MEYIKRSMEEVFLRLNKEYSAILVTGPRQVGKTTMLEKLMRDGYEREYVSLDDMNERRLAKTDPAMFFQIHKPPLLIDEIQYAPELLPYIKIQIDQHPTPGAFWLTGSQLFKLMSGVQESLAGRIALLHLSLLSQQEIYQSCPANAFIPDLDTLYQKQKQITPADTNEIYTRLFNGGMPALIGGRYSDRSRFYSDYVGTYLERDIKELSGTIDSLKFMNFITAVAARAGQIVNYKSIGDECDIALHHFQGQRSAVSHGGHLNAFGPQLPFAHGSHQLVAVMALGHGFVFSAVDDPIGDVRQGGHLVER